MRTPSQEEKEKFVEALSVLAEATAGTVQPQRLLTYCSLLLPEYELSVLLNTCTAFTRELGRTFFPTVPEFHAKIFGDPDSRATQALAVLYKAMKKTGGYRNVAFKDQVLMAVVERDGWIQVAAGVPDDQLSYWEHNFRRVYAQGCSERWQPSRPYLIGKCAAENLETSGTWERGKLPEPVVDVYELDGTRTKEVPLKLIAPKSPLVELYEADQKRLTEGSAREAQEYRCQFCGQVTPAPDWTDDACPKCGCTYATTKGEKAAE